MPDALHSLAELGVIVTPEHGATFSGIRFTDGIHAVGAAFPHGKAVGIRRTRLHQLMVDQAEKQGLSISWNSKVTYLDQHSILLNGSLVRCRWLIGADGQQSTLRRWAGLDETSRLEQRYGFRRHYKVVPWTDFVEVHWGPRGQLFITPVGPADVGVALITRDPTLRIDDVLPEFPFVERKLAGAPVSSQERGSVTTTRRLKRVTVGAIALTGDASGSVDAVTGEGLSISFRQAIALADAIASSNLRAYQTTHERIVRMPAVMSDLLLLMDRFPRLRTKALSAMSMAPDTFEQFLSVHVGHKSLWRFLFKEAPHFGWRLITA